MPLPFILWGAAAAVGALGAKKAYDAHSKNNQAERINEQAEDLVNSAKAAMEYTRKKTKSSLEDLGEAKANILKNDIVRFVDVYSRIKNIHLNESAGIDEMRNLKLDKQTLSEMKEMGDMATALLSGTAGGALAGALTGLGAYGLTMTFGAASTGTAIGALTGIAAQNATLAFLGGGSLAAGGLGVAGGMAVLGGLVAGPALAVMGFTMNSKAEANLQNARRNRAQARKIKEELAAGEDVCRAIAKKADMFTDLLYDLGRLFSPLVRKMANIVNIEGEDFSQYSEEEVAVIAAACAVAKAVKQTIDTPILTKDGNLDVNASAVLENMNRFKQKMQYEISMH